MTDASVLSLDETVDAYNPDCGDIGNQDLMFVQGRFARLEFAQSPGADPELLEECGGEPEPSRLR